MAQIFAISITIKYIKLEMLYKLYIILVVNAKYLLIPYMGEYISHTPQHWNTNFHALKRKNVLNQFRMRRIMLQNRNKLWNIASVKYCQGNRRRFTIVYNNNTLFLLCARCANFLNGNPTNFKINSSHKFFNYFNNNVSHITYFINFPYILRQISSVIEKS